MPFERLIQSLEIIEVYLERRQEKVPTSILELHQYCKRSKNRKFEIDVFNELFNKCKSDLQMLVQDGYLYFKTEEERKEFCDTFEMLKDQELSDMNPEITDLKKAVPNSIRRVISYYKKYGINLGHFPSFEFIGNHPTGRDIVASVNADEYSHIRYLSIVSALATRFYYKKYFNLNLSQEAVEEAIKLYEKPLLRKLSTGNKINWS